MISKAKHRVIIEKSRRFRLNFGKTREIILSVAMDEKDIMAVVKSIPKRCNTDMVKYKVFVSVESGRKTFILTNKREGLHAKLYSDENFVETRMVVRVRNNNPLEDIGLGCFFVVISYSFIFVFAYEFKNISPTLIMTVCGVPITLFYIAVVFSSIRAWLKPSPGLIDFLKGQLEQ